MVFVLADQHPLEVKVTSRQPVASTSALSRGLWVNTLLPTSATLTQMYTLRDSGSR